VHTLAAVAAARGADPSRLEEQVDANATAAFGL
jgi:Tat protein secretion system quality control protein TatD with DNase activity